MFEKFSRNQPVQGTVKEPIYNPNPDHDDVDFEQLKNADMIDKQEYAEALAADMTNMKKRDDEKAKKEIEDAEAKEAARIEKYLENKAKKAKEGPTPDGKPSNVPPEK